LTSIVKGPSNCQRASSRRQFRFLTTHRVPRAEQEGRLMRKLAIDIAGRADK
jgi:hypothetical protein